MVNVCLVGCGGVGRRHLEAMIKVKQELNIEVVEPYLKNKIENNNISYFNDIKDVSDNIDICLIATKADIRKKVILDLVHGKNVKFMILEKVVFQNERDFDEIIKLLKSKNIKCWVNCHLRAQPIYKELKKQSMVEHDTYFTYDYSDDFTLSTSAIHILDLFAYLCNDYNLRIIRLKTDETLTKSKHEGCFDFNGNMEVVSTNNHKLSVQKVNRVFGEHLTIQSPSVQVKAGEGTDPDNKVGFVNDKKIPYLYQSSLTNLYIEDIINKSDCDLSTLENSAILHKMMLATFRDLFSKKYNREVMDCPIT